MIGFKGRVTRRKMTRLIAVAIASFGFAPLFGSAHASTTAERAIRVIARTLEVDEKKITQNTTFSQDLGTSTWDIVEVGMALEEEFDVHVPDAVMDRWVTVGDAINHIASCQIRRRVRHRERSRVLAPGCSR